MNLIIWNNLGKIVISFYEWEGKNELVQAIETEGVDRACKYHLRRLCTFTCHALGLKMVRQGRWEWRDLLEHTCGLEGVLVLSKLTEINLSRSACWCLD